MDHDQAIQESFVEKYLLGELSPAQRDEFEDHYFDCFVCAEDVQNGAVFVDNARALLRSEEPAGDAVSHFTGFGLPFRAAALASVILLGLVGYQNLVTIPGLLSTGSLSGGSRMARIVPRISLIGMGSRAAAQSVVVPSGKDASFELEIPGGPGFVSYECRIIDAAHQIKSVMPVPPELAKDAFTLEIPGSQLIRGAYQIIVSGLKAGGDQQELTRIPLSVN
jgi:hypothetical protein